MAINDKGKAKITRQEVLNTPTTMHLPSEILGLVFGSLDKATLSNVRLVCKSFKEAASPFLFDQVYVSNVRADLEIAYLTVLRFGHYVRTLVFATTYTDYCANDIKRSIARTKNHMLPGCFDRHLHHAWNTFVRQRVAWQEVSVSGELLRHLCFVLSRIPRFQTIKISAFRLFRFASRESFKTLKPEYLCPQSMCMSQEAILEFEPSFIDPDFVEQNSVCLDVGTSGWQTMILALRITKVLPRNIISDHSRGYQPISSSAFDMSGSQGLYVRESFAHLIKLRLTLTEDLNRWSTRIGDAYVQGNIAKALATAINLEQLELDFGELDSPSFEAILEGCEFPKLKSLNLSWIMSSENQLVGLLRSSPGLETLQLSYHGLMQGLWERVAHWIKVSLRPLSVHLGMISGGMPKPFDGDDWWCFSQQEVEDFILRNGDNPFTKAALEWKKAEEEAAHAESS